MATTATNAIEGQKRPDESRGKNEAKRLRASGSIPAVLYGAKKEPVAIALNPKQITAILHSDSGHNTIFDLKVGSEQTKAMIVDWLYEPVKGSLMHVDLKRIAMDQVLRVSVPVVLVGIAAGVKQQGGIMDQVVREVEIECLPGDIPGHIDVDVSAMMFGQVLRVADLPHSAKWKFITDENQAVAHVTAVKEEVVATPDAAAEGAAAAPAEPEVIKKGKQDTEEGAAEPAAKGEKKK
jgi:large subunit ribosomal protein L25